MLIDYTPNEVYEKHFQNFDPNAEIAINTDIIVALGSEEVKAIGVPDQIKLEIRFEGVQKPHLYYQYIKGFLSALVTEDPTKVHFDIVRATLRKIDPALLDDKGLIDMMVRELIERCRSLKLALKTPKKIQELFDKTKVKKEDFAPLSGRIAPYLQIINLDLSSELEYLFEKEGMFIWDNALLSIMGRMGASGRRAAKQYKKALQERLNLYKLGHQRPVDFWFNAEAPTPEEPFHTSPALQVLMSHIYEDVVKKKRDYEKRYPPSLPKPIYSSVNILHKGKIKEADDQIQVFNEGSLIGSLPIAAIDPSLYNRVFRGVDKFRTVTGHRLLRFLPQKSHNQYASGINPCNTLSFPGGYAQIAEEAGLTGKKVITDIKDLVHGLAFINWSFPDFTGNFIVLNEYKQAITRNQNPGIKITLGPELSPHYASKHRLLLIPILKDPQLVGPTQYYANQYLLQNEIMAEFSNQSIRLAEDGIVILTDEIWEKGGLPSRLRNLVKTSWTQDNDGERFLEEKDKNAYTLGPAYHKELKFLKEQGELRKQNSINSIAANDKKKNRRYPSSN